MAIEIFGLKQFPPCVGMKDPRTYYDKDFRSFSSAKKRIKSLLY
jgi:hypothetical protein